ncbi:M81 family metallopeptidase [Mesorhizobium australicum]|uniref:M81 family metallopeptidase n=1 Tax=Mesorhizobium australicum TaxID=536018 RepID=A0ACC6T6Q9_9HYPH
MTFKIAIGGIEHETNTFCAGEVQLSDFNIERGHSITDTNRGVRSYIGGMLDAAAALGATVVPTILATTEPAGLISRSAYSRMIDDLIADIDRSLPLDAVVLALHGAGIAEGIGNIEVDICRRVRELVGSDVKIVITLDLHGNLSPKLCEFIDAAFGTHYHPHIDMFERGQDAVNIIPRLLDGSLATKVYIEKLPFLLAPVTTMYGSAAAINEMCRSMEEEPDIVSCTFFHGFPYADSLDTGASVLTVANRDAEKAKDAAKRVSRFVWDSRNEIRAKALTPEEAIRSALTSEDWPVVVLDGADNPGGGCPGDGTYLLSAMLQARLKDACFAMICDPAVVAQARHAGAGATIDVELGGKVDQMHGAPIAATAYIKALTDGRQLRRSPMGQGMQVSVGPTARLQVQGIDIVVVSDRSQVMDPEIFLMHGILVSRYRIVGVKSTNHWRAGFAGLIKRDYLADSPGLMSQDLTRYSYKLIPRPIWPLDQETGY